MSQVHVVSHPLVQHKLTHMRRVGTSTAEFRRLLAEIAPLLLAAATEDLPMTTAPITTPLASFDAPVLDGRKLALVSILRAGNGLLDGMLQLIPSARVGHVGMYRDEDTLNAHEYYFKLPSHVPQRDLIVVDPMLATGNTAVMALTRLKRENPRSLRFICLVAAPEGVHALSTAHPDVPIWTAAVDERLNEQGYIVPGLGDAGDRIYGTG